ncbi:uncharacterized protein LOC128208761 [Mya arenaria]|uniref:uncharacterized protein LOC128208761 n=1 Tax=Mya arenaria TaxID=6604 RepID=UPI0022E5407C|nr:uncharacterized protein LOC128208761 [Mya arenaria]XP_052768304.1 uncharacterized protein LOC128208761 [Mya arenaria]
MKEVLRCLLLVLMHLVLVTSTQDKDAEWTIESNITVAEAVQMLASSNYSSVLMENLRNHDFSKDQYQQLLLTLPPTNPNGEGSTGPMTAKHMFAEAYVREVGGYSTLTYEDLEFWGNRAIVELPAQAYDTMKKDTFLALVDLMYAETKKSADYCQQRKNMGPDGNGEQYTDQNGNGGQNMDQNGNETQTMDQNGNETQNMNQNGDGGQNMGPNGDGVQIDYAILSSSMMSDLPVHLSKMCKRISAIYKPQKDTKYSEKDIQRLLVFLICLPQAVCKAIPAESIFSNMPLVSQTPFYCSPSFPPEILEGFREMQSSKACATALIDNLSSGSNPLVNLDAVDSKEEVEKLGPMTACLRDDVLIGVIDKIPCDQVIGGVGFFPAAASNYILRKCYTLPTDYSNITCEVLDQGREYPSLLSYLPSAFYRNMPANITCDPACSTLFSTGRQKPEFYDGIIMEKCYASSDVKLDSAAVAQMGSMVAELPVDKIEEISAADLVSNMDTIKKGLKKKNKGKGSRNKNAIRQIMKKVALEKGDVSAMSDCQTCMETLSLKDLKNSVSDPAQIIVKLGIDKHDVQLTDSQAKFVAKKLMKDGTNRTADDFRQMKSLVKGLMSADIKKIATENADSPEGMEIAKVFCEQSSWPTKTLMSIRNELILKGLQMRNATAPMGTLSKLDVESFGCECMMNFEADDMLAMEPDVCWDVCIKVGQCDNLVHLNPRHRKNFLYACMKCKDLNPKSFTEGTITDLGPALLSKLTSTQLSSIPNSAFPAIYPYLSTMCMNWALHRAASSKISSVVSGQGGKLPVEDMYKLSGAMYLLSSALQRSLDKMELYSMAEQILTNLVPQDANQQYFRDSCEKWLSGSDLTNIQKMKFQFMVTLKNAMISSYSISKRRKRSTSGGFSWTCDNVQAYGELFLTATDSEIMGMDNDEFKICLSDIGLMDWTAKQKTTWRSKLLSAYSVSTVCDVPDKTNFGTLVQAFTKEEIACLPLSDTTMVASLGSLNGWTADQITALASGYLTASGNTSLSASTDSDVAMLGAIMCGFETSVIATLPATVLVASGATFSMYESCDTDRLAALKGVAIHVDAYGPVASWTAASVSELKYIFGGISAEDMPTLSVEAIEGVSPDVIPLIPGTVLKAMTSDQLGAFTDAQAVAVTSSQKMEMSEEQQAKLDDLSTLGQEALGDPEVGVDSSSASMLVANILLLCFLALHVIGGL